jgi:hypothetical protein
MLFHGSYLMDEYTATAALWRDEATMEKLTGYCILGHLILVSVLGVIFARGYEGKGYQEGCRFGVLVGLLLAGLNISTFAYLPIPSSLLSGWILGSLVEGQVIGVSLALIYQLKPEAKAKAVSKAETKTTTKAAKKTKKK